MRSFHLTEDEKANISMDFLTAVAVIVIAFIFAVSVLSSIITPYSGYSKELYPTADRAVTLLVEDKGYWECDDGEGTDWEFKWNYSGNYNYSNVTKIGLLDSNEKNTLDPGKINTIMENQGSWWEYPVSSSSGPELDNASRAMGLGRYNFYIQIRPLNESKYNVSAANQRATEMVGDKGDVVSVVRYSRMNQLDYGTMSLEKPLFGLDNNNFSYILSNGGIEFTVANLSIIPDHSQTISDISIGIGLNHESEITHSHDLQNDVFEIYKNGNLTTLPVSVSEVSDIIKINIPINTINNIDNWESADLFYVQLNGDNLMASQPGITFFSSNSTIEEFSLKTTIWVW
ncbi:MAG: hypothetical protein HF976_11780 [ANME-2 cluster archaeon]|nr:hypothetical protein [ANME-2 cluster archaeon]MBC2702063.1 hypothetical protein [ANME-2 cluster archaeon]MBC2708833.1 hypothetical protein [ANME-2 cluster archaeon]